VFSLGAGGELAPQMLDASMFEGLRCLHLMGSTLSMSAQALETGLRALEMAQACGAKFSFDPNLRPELLAPEQARIVFQPFVDAADVLMPTEAELRLLTESENVQAAVDRLTAVKADRVIVLTQGAQGCTVYADGMAQQVPGFAVQEVDPTGAGDCFDAGFLAGWLGGASAIEAARLGNACGALAVTRQGPMAGAEKLEVVRAFMANQP
jgi:sugar/nucleoside kinase (ribokinase family)